VIDRRHLVAPGELPAKLAERFADVPRDVAKVALTCRNDVRFAESTISRSAPSRNQAIIDKNYTTGIIVPGEHADGNIIPAISRKTVTKKSGAAQRVTYA